MRRIKKKPSAVINILFLAAGIACLAYYIAMGVIVRFNQSVAWIWPLASLLLLVRFFMVCRMRRTGKRPFWPRWITVVFHTLLAAGFAWFFTVEGMVFSGSFASAPDNADYIVVLGGKVNGTEPSGVLNNRIEYACDYMARNPDCLCVASGGQGDDEGISEAQCIYNGLTRMGISPDRIILEENSSSTRENLIFSFDIIGDETATVAVITNNFHMFRTMRLARALFPERTVYGISVHTTPLSYPHYMMRESLSTTVEALKGEISLF